MPSDGDLPRLSFSCEDDATGDRRPKNILGDHFSDFGERDRADRLTVMGDGEVSSRGNVGVGGGCRGVINLSAGFIVLTSPFAIELIEALR